MTPGTQPQMDKINTIIIDPQPWSITANGGHKIDKKTLNKLIKKNSYKYSYLLKINALFIFISIKSIFVIITIHCQ